MCADIERLVVETSSSCTTWAAMVHHTAAAFDTVNEDSPKCFAKLSNCIQSNSIVYSQQPDGSKARVVAELNGCVAAKWMSVSVVCRPPAHQSAHLDCVLFRPLFGLR